MKVASVAVVGGGPAGLFAARRLKESQPQADVTVYEQVKPDSTFGFGVGLAAATQQRLRQADPEVFAALATRAHRSLSVRMQVGNASAVLPQTSIAISRTHLLELLRVHAEQVGVRIEYGAQVDARQLQADLVVAADGVNSRTRQGLTKRLGVNIRRSPGYYLWAGTDFALDETLFTSATSVHGDFVAHAYPYAADRSTFLVETDAHTLSRAGFVASTTDANGQVSDGKALDFLSVLFASALTGRRLLGHETRWGRFRTVSCDRWHVGNIVLVGDAAHTAHYSIGSGTKLAMEDAIALSSSVTGATDLEAALAHYEAERIQRVTRSQAAAARSESWWGLFMNRAHLPVDTVMLSYMTRTGRVGLASLRDDAPDLTERALRSLGVTPGNADPDTAVLSTGYTHRDTTFADRTVTRADLATLGTVTLKLPADVGVSVFWLTGGPDDGAVTTRLNLGERITLAYPGATVVVEAPLSSRSEVAAAIASNRCHLVAWQDSANPHLHGTKR